MKYFSDTQFMKNCTGKDITLKPEEADDLLDRLTDKGGSLADIEPENILRLIEKDDAIMRLYSVKNNKERAERIRSALRSAPRIFRKRRRFFV